MESDFILPEATKSKRRLALSRKDAPILLIAAIVVLSTPFQVLAEDEQTFQIFTGLQAITVGVSLLWWCHMDAAERNYRVGRISSILIFLFGFIFLPIYLLRSRGVRGIISVAVAALLFMLFLGLQLAAAWITEKTFLTE